MRKTILVVLVLLFLTFRPQEVSAFWLRLPFRSFPTISKPIPTRIPRQIWSPFRPKVSPTITPSLTPTSTPTPSINVQPPYFKLELANEIVPVRNGESFLVKILINTGGVETINGDAVLIYDPIKLKIDSAYSDNFYTFSYSTPIGTNKYLLSSWEESIAHAKQTSSDTPFATLTITAKEQGSTSIGFDCTTGSEADTNINTIDSHDIVNCPLIPLNFNIE